MPARVPCAATTILVLENSRKVEEVVDLTLMPTSIILVSSSVAPP